MKWGVMRKKILISTGCGWCILCFLIFSYFLVLTIKAYPGGSFLDKQHVGYDFWANYWCDLFKTKAVNGQLNTARPTAMITFALFLAAVYPTWLFIVELVPKPVAITKIIAFCGPFSVVASMTIPATASLPRIHGLALFIVGVTGITAFTLSTLLTLNRRINPVLNCMGVLSAITASMNLVAYGRIHFGADETSLLPILQKISTFCFIGWALNVISVTFSRRHQLSGQAIEK